MLEMFLAVVETDEQKEKVARIYEKYYRLMMYIINKYVSNISDVEDLAQDCMLRIIDNIDIVDLSDESRAKGLFITIARNCAIDYLKKNKNIMSLDEAYYEDACIQSPEEVFIENYTLQQIQCIIDNMNSTYRDVCRLKYVYNYKEREIALILNLSPKVVNQRIYRGKQELRALIMKESLV